MDWVESYRREFPAVDRCVYMDTAYDCGGSEIGRKAAQRYFDDWASAAVDNERGGPGRATFFRLLDETRTMLGSLLGGVGADQIAFTRNTNEGINAILQGFDFAPGDNIVTGAIEHASVLMPSLNCQKTRGVECRIAGDPDMLEIPPELLMRSCDDHTRMILVSHVQSATGYRIDLKKLGDFCREKGIFLAVDAIQSLGQVPFDVPGWNVSAVSAAGYKGLGASESTGFLYASPQLLEHIWPVYTAAGFCMRAVWEDGKPSLRCLAPDKAKKLENSSPDNLGVYVLHDALERLLSIGIENIWEHINTLYGLLYDGLTQLGYKVCSARDAQNHGASLLVEVSDAEKAFTHFRSRNIALSMSRNRFLRLSIGAYTNGEDIEKTLAAAKDCPVR